MNDLEPIPGSDGDLAVLAGIVADATGADAAVRRAEIGQLRVLARAGRLAAAQASRSRESVRAQDMALRAIAAELGGVLRVTDRTMQRRIDDACEIVDHYPATLQAWEAGEITRGHVRVIVETGSVVPEEARAEFEAEAIGRCRRDTPNRVKAGLEILAERMSERSFTQRHQHAAAGRAVRLIPGRDGMSDLVATLPTVIAEGILDRLTQQARALLDSSDTGGRDERTGDAGDTTGRTGHPADPRTVDQVRADIFSDLLLTGSPALDPSASGDGTGVLGAIRAQVQVIVPVLTLLGADDGPVDLVGRTPIDADTARRLASGAPSWARVLTDPIQGTVIAVDRYRTPWPQRRYLRARDQHCRFPGCRVAAIRCDIDHTTDAALGGPTTLTNLAHLCRRHHSMKHATHWHVTQLPHGTLEWTSPLGKTYREDAPTPPVHFTPAPATVPDEAPPPF